MPIPRSRLRRLFSYSKDTEFDAQENFTTEALAIAIEDDQRPMVDALFSVVPYEATRVGLWNNTVETVDTITIRPSTQVSLPQAGAITNSSDDCELARAGRGMVHRPSSGARRKSGSPCHRGRRGKGVIVVTSIMQRVQRKTDRPVWICPKCGARLITRNLWHSCGKFTLAALFRGARPGVLSLARKYVRMLQALGDVQVIPQKTRLVCVARVRFAGLYPRKTGFLASFALRRQLDSPRIVKTADYGPRWRGHFVAVESLDDLDDELRIWLQEAHDTVGLQDDQP